MIVKDLIEELLKLDQEGHISFYMENFKRLEIDKVVNKPGTIVAGAECIIKIAGSIHFKKYES